jgi:hypothetical protein
MPTGQDWRHNGGDALAGHRPGSVTERDPYWARRAQYTLWVPKTSSTSCDQAIFVDQATDASVSSDAVLLKVDRFG